MTQTVLKEIVASDKEFPNVLIVGMNSRAAVEFANAWATQGDASIVSTRRNAQLDDRVQRVELSNVPFGTAANVVVFLSGTHEFDDQLVVRLKRITPTRVCFVSGCSVHFNDKLAEAREQNLLVALPNADVSIIRIANMSGRTVNRLKRYSSTLLPGTVRSCFVEPLQLVRCVGAVFSSCRAGRRLTLLGENRAWREELSREDPSVMDQVGKVGGSILRLIGAGYVIRLGVAGLKWFAPRFRAFSFDTITPTSESELLALCNRHNKHHIAVCGYNNGGNHFGWRYPGKTVVPTCRSGNEIRIEGDHVTVDAGVTLKRCIEKLKEAGKEFYVVPNFSYIGMGTAFFVPIHGSGSEVSTLGDTIEWVRFFNPSTDRTEEATRSEKLFDESMYRMDTGLVLLQLRLRIRDRASYFVRKTELVNPAAADVWALFDDPDTSNIEVRKNKAAHDVIEVSKYYTTDSPDPELMEVPRDSIGRVWDRIEENKFSAWLFHWFVRTMAFHVELFLTEQEFEVFWDHHRELPVSKIQLRYARRDGMKHSPFGQHDCVSADLFMTKRNRAMFLEFIREYLPSVRFNPGKQSM